LVVVSLGGGSSTRDSLALGVMLAPIQARWLVAAWMALMTYGGMAYPTNEDREQRVPQYQASDYPGVPEDIRAFYAHEQNPYQQAQSGYVYPQEQMPDDPDMLQEDTEWPSEYVSQDVGQVGGLAVCPMNNVHVFHRGKRVWEEDTFDDNNKYTHQDEGPIKGPAIEVLSEHDGRVLRRLGANQFYFPHGLTMDADSNYWLTDVALHQVIKYDQENDKVLLTMGKAFEPATDNKDQERFCKPTDVAVASNGLVFIADGYCNSRIVVTTDNGTWLGSFGEDDFLVPHSIALAEDLDILAVADRDNERILLFNAGLENPEMLGDFEQEIAFPELGRVFAIDYSARDGHLLAVTQASYGSELASAYSIDIQDRSQPSVTNWTPREKIKNGPRFDFDMPHDIAVSSDGNIAYVGLVDTDTDRKVWKFDRE